MPISYYLDTSAVAKLYLIDEKGADFMLMLIEEAMPDEIFCISSFGVLELHAVIMRQVQSARRVDEALRNFIQDTVRIFQVLPTNEEILDKALPVVHTHKLRAGDAVHLATALSIAAVSDYTQVFMVTSDHELLAAASSAGLGAIDPQSDEAIDGLLHIRAQ